MVCESVFPAFLVLCYDAAIIMSKCLAIKIRSRSQTNTTHSFVVMQSSYVLCAYQNILVYGILFLSCICRLMAHTVCRPDVP